MAAQLLLASRHDQDFFDNVQETLCHDQLLCFYMYGNDNSAATRQVISIIMETTLIERGHSRRLHRARNVPSARSFLLQPH
ncbi:hypothetical protein [Altericroceibacterium xinjiangense]|uniref:hypothetical protein n=1 Tax=Altericroceibacterium xinjiangense TaxID=762261 RepID=UPI000F7EBE85|nr:hypothetical protein [Altericroceibacterium xinjiangense]